jgi:hypothetical protein
MHGLQWDYSLIPATTREYVCISTVIKEMSKMPCKKYLSGSEKRTKETEASAWKLPKISPSDKIYM